MHTFNTNYSNKCSEYLNISFLKTRKTLFLSRIIILINCGKIKFIIYTQENNPSLKIFLLILHLITYNLHII